MIVEDQEFSLSKILIVVGIVVFISSLVYISVITSKLISLRKVTTANYAKEKLQLPPAGSTQPYQMYKAPVPTHPAGSAR